MTFVFVQFSSIAPISLLIVCPFFPILANTEENRKRSYLTRLELLCLLVVSRLRICIATLFAVLLLLLFFHRLSR